MVRPAATAPATVLQAPQGCETLPDTPLILFTLQLPSKSLPSTLGETMLHGIERLGIIVLVLLTVVTAPAHAASKTTVGLDITCADWTKYDGSRKMWMNYINGVLTGWNMGAVDEPDFIMPNGQPTAWEAWLTNYCAQNALNHVMTAVWALHGELLKRATGKPQ